MSHVDMSAGTHLLPHQVEALNAVAGLDFVALYHDMGLGKTFSGAELAQRYNNLITLVVCQKSKVMDWVKHFVLYYRGMLTFDITTPSGMYAFFDQINRQPFDPSRVVGVINYDLIFRRKELMKLKDITLILDESSLIQNPQAKRTKAVMSMNYKNLILLSGTPCSGKYEGLWTQMNMLGWKISEEMFFNQFVDFYWDTDSGFPVRIITGYKNEERLKRKMRQHGCHFLKTEEVMNLPDQVFQQVMVPSSKWYKTFKEDRIVQVDGRELVGDTTLTKLLYERQLCGAYSEAKFEAFEDILNSTNDRLVVFYNFNLELDRLMEIAVNNKRPFGVVNGSQKNPEVLNTEGAVLFVQYQAGSMGLNLQIANRIVYFSPPLSSELFEQSKKRTHRIGQNKTCFYYQLICSGSVEQKIYRTLEMRKDYTEALFEEGEGKNED